MPMAVPRPWAVEFSRKIRDRSLGKELFYWDPELSGIPPLSTVAHSNHIFVLGWMRLWRAAQACKASSRVVNSKASVLKTGSDEI